MKLILFVFMLVASINLSAQSEGLDSINFYDTLVYTQKINLKDNGNIDFVEYIEKSGNLKKIDYYDSKQRISNDKIWDRNLLVREVKYKYFENNQVIERYDIMNNEPLPTQLNLNFKYPALARENEVEGIVKVEIKYTETCVPSSFKILDTLGYGIEKEVDKKMKLMIKLANKYNISFDECKKVNEYFKVIFKLE